MLGESGSGKTSLSLRFSADEFRPYLASTVGASFFETSMIYQDDDEDGTEKKTNIVFKIWDTAGQEKYHALASMYYRGAAAAILVFDISRASSFQTLQGWVEELKDKGPPDIFMVVCGNKSDLDESGDRQVSQQEAEAYAVDVGACYIETSAKDNKNVRELFKQVAKKVADNSNASEDTGTAETPINLGARSQDLETSSCCGS